VSPQGAGSAPIFEIGAIGDVKKISDLHEWLR
jgi:hypothetical protein